LRIALNGWFADQAGTGSGQYVYGLLEAFARAGSGDQFLLVVPEGHSAFSFAGLDLRVAPFPSRAWRGNAGKVLFEQVAFPWACRRFRADVAHVPYWGSPLVPSAPTLVTVHDVIPLLLPAYRGGPLVRLYTALAAASARRAALILTDSQASRQDLHRHLRVPPDRVRCIYLAAAEQFRPESAPGDAAVRARYGLPARYVLYLAGHDVRKNVAGLLDAFAIVARADDDVALVVGGSLPASTPHRSLLRGEPPTFDPRPRVAALGLAGRVRFLGWVDEADKPALYRGAACAAFPSRYEGFGLPVLEALACGTPLVASNSSSLPELLGDSGFAVDPDDTRGLAGALLACLVDDGLASELRRRGPIQAARFTWSQTAGQTLDAYRAVQ
jgi:glycosyltransferase involved in cell wall biosynthesis